jgi:hypothetical protein
LGGFGLPCFGFGSVSEAFFFLVFLVSLVVAFLGSNGWFSKWERCAWRDRVDGRVKPGHDGGGCGGWRF